MLGKEYMSYTTCQYFKCGQPLLDVEAIRTRLGKVFCSKRCRDRDDYHRKYSSPYLHTDDVPSTQAEIDAITDNVYGNGQKGLTKQERTMKGYLYGPVGIRSGPRRLIR